MWEVLFFSFCETGQELLTTSRSDRRTSSSAGSHLVVGSEEGIPPPLVSSEVLCLVFSLSDSAGPVGSDSASEAPAVFISCFFVCFCFVLLVSSSAGPLLVQIVRCDGGATNQTACFGTSKPRLRPPRVARISVENVRYLCA